MSGYEAGERCRNYGTEMQPRYKPIGLLQEYGTGTPAKIKFALMTGYYEKNKSGGVLRKGMGSLDTESSGDGSFNNNTHGIIDHLKRFIHTLTVLNGRCARDGSLS